MGALSSRAVRLISVAAVGVAFAVPAFTAAPSTLNVAVCPNGMVANPGSYGCVPYRPGFGAPTQEVLTRCHGNYWICIWPYP